MTGQPIQPLSPVEQHVLDQLRERLAFHGVLPAEYGILEPKPDALVLERVPGGWHIQFWDANRGPSGHPTVFPRVLDAAQILLAMLLWGTDMDDARARHRAGRDNPA